MRKAALFLILSLLISPRVWADTFKVDPHHTSVMFKIRHLFSNVKGTFNEYEGMIQYDPAKPETWSVEATVKTASIDTGVEPRDKHLRSADFFDAEKFPTLTFKSSGVTDVQDNKAKLNGLLSIHGVEKPVTFDLEIHGVGKDPWGNVRGGFTATTKINRKDFGLNWNETLETGQVLVGEEVEIILEVEGIKQT